MTAVSTLTGWLVMPDGDVVPASSVEVTLDETWSPFVQGTVVVPYSAYWADLVNPQTHLLPQVRVGVRRAWAGRPTLDELGAAWAGLTLADLGAEWVGLTLADLKAGWLVEWDSGDKPSDELIVTAWVRSRRVSQRDATLTVTVASAELCAQQTSRAMTRPAETLAARLLAVLTGAGVPVLAADFTAGAAVTLTAETIPWTSSTWDICSGWATTAGLRLWCDLDGTWRLTDPAAALVGTVSVTRATDGDDSADVDDSDYADTLICTCKAQGLFRDPVTDSQFFADATEVLTYPNPVPDGLRKVYAIERDYGQLDVASIPEEFLPTTAELAAILAAHSRRDRTQSLTAPADPTARPGMNLTTGAPSLPATTGRLAAVTIRIPEDTMTLTGHHTQDA